MSRITIVDYGVGNLRSVARAIEHVGAVAELTSDITTIAQAERLLLPGVGAFGHCMQELEKRGLTGPVRNFAASGKPLMGICVGMQMLMETSEEFGEHKGLGLIPGRVRVIPRIAPDGSTNILPSIGWMPIRKPAGKEWAGSFLDGYPEGNPMYFLHSYYAEPTDPATRLAEYDFNGTAVTAAMQSKNLIGLQFHPEKSAEGGLALIRKFSLL